MPDDATIQDYPAGFRPAKPKAQQFPAGFRPAPPQFRPQEADKDVPESVRRVAGAARGTPTTPTPTPTTPPQPGQPSLLDRAKSTVANSAIGHTMEKMTPKLADALGMHPTETVYNPYAAAHAREIIALGAAIQGPGVAKGAAEFAGGLATPEMVLMSAGSGGIGLLEPLVGKAGIATVGKLVSLGFSMDMLRGAISEYPELKEAIKNGDYDTAKQIATEMGLSTVFAATAFKHAGTETPEEFGTLDRKKAAAPEALVGGETLADYGARRARELRQRVLGTIQNTNENRAKAVAAADRINAPIPTKRPFEEPAQIVRGRMPLSSTEREQERYDERVRQVKENIAAEKKRRLDIAHAALHQGLDVEQRQLDDIQERQERRVREGEAFNVVDRRAVPPELTRTAGITPPPATTGTSPETPPEAGMAPLPPPSAADIHQLEHHEAAASWSILEYERRLGKTDDPVERAELKKEIKENKELLKDVRADKRAAEMLTSAKPPATRKPGDRIDGLSGREDVLKTVTADIPISYKVVEGGDLKTSHDPETFEPTKGYPDGVQERDYKNDKDAQVAVIQHGQQYDPKFTTSDSPGPEHGPPIVTPDGIVLGGNSRVMSTMRHYDESGEFGENGELYRTALAAKARQFGIDPDKIAGMKNPILVREITNPPDSIQELRALGSDLNRTFTRALSEFEQAVSAGKRISQETLDYVGSQLTEMGEGASLRDLLRERPGPILEKFSTDGIISDQERRKYVDEKTGALNDTGKDYFERALLGAVIDDPLVLANAPKGALRKVERALAPLAKIKARGEPWDITDYVKEALREHIAAASKGVSIQDHLQPSTLSMFPREPLHPVTEAIARNLDENSAAVKKAFEGYAEDADVDVKGQGGLAFFNPPTPWESFDQNFKSNVRPDEWGTLAAAGEEEAPTGWRAAGSGEAAPSNKTPKATPVPTDTAKSRSENFRTALETVFPDLTPDQVSSAMSLVDARAKAIGLSTDDWLAKHGIEVEARDSGTRASVTFEENKTIIRAFSEKHPSIASLVHEIGHIFRRDLSPEELAAAEKAFSVSNGEWDRQKEEQFARTFEKYLADGKAPTPELKGVFAKLKDWIVGLYKAAKGAYVTEIAPGRRGTPLNIKISPEMEDLFDKILGGEDRPVEPPKESSFGEFLGTKGMSEEDLRAASGALESQLGRGLSPEAKARIEAQKKPFDAELKRRNVAEKKGDVDRSVLFPKSQFDNAIEALKKKKPPITLNYTDDEEETIKLAASAMGHLFENGYRDYDSNSARIQELIGPWLKPYTRSAFDRMLTEGKRTAQQKLGGIIPEAERQKYSTQLGLFETHEAKNRKIELPAGVEVPHETSKTPSAQRPDDARKKLDARPGTEGRTALGSTPGATDQPRGREPLGSAGRGVRSAGEAGRGGGVQETPNRQLRSVQAPKLDVDIIPSLNPAVEPGEWKNRLVAANLAAEIPPPTVSLTPSVEDKLIFKGQPEIVQTALTSLEKYNAVVLATTTGTGKTYTGSAIFAEKNPRMGLILTPSTNLNENWINTAKEFGVDVKPLPKDGIPKEPGVYVATYATAGGKEGLEKVGWNLLLADESHKARRWYAGTGTGVFLQKLANATDQVVFASATPFHSALELGYMDKLGLWKKQGFDNWAAKEFNTYKSDSTGNWVSPFNPRKLAALRQELINRGMFVNLDRDMRGYDVNFAIKPLGQEEVQGIKDTARAFSLAEEYFNQRKNPAMVRAVRGNAVTFMKSYLERARLPEAIELGKKLENAGWKVVYFTENKTEVQELYNFLKPADQHFNGVLSRLLPKLPGVVETLKESFGDDIANFTGAHSADRQEELDAFNRGDKKHLIATYGAGGLGVSMHDLTGDAPRAAIYLGPPYSGVMFDQAIGRPWRFGTKSNVNAYFLTSNAAPEMKLLFGKVLPRFESLKAAISGVNKADPIVSKMKDLDGLLDYQLGNKDKAQAGDFAHTEDTKAISNIKEVKIPLAEDAKNKGMQVERRKPMMPPETLNYKEPPLGDLGVPRSNAAESAKAVRRPLVPKETEKGINDPRDLDYLQDQNRAALGMPGGDEKPPMPPDEVVGVATIPPPGSASVEYDLHNPKLTRWAYEAAKDRYGDLGMDDHQIAQMARFEGGLKAISASLHTAPWTLRQFKLTEELPRNFQRVEGRMLQKIANYRVDANKIMGKFANDATADRRIFEALQRAHDPVKELQGASSEWVDHKPFTPEELNVAQRLRDEILNPIIDAVQDVRPDVGRRYRYAPLVRQIDELTPILEPLLSTDGKIPSNLVKDFSLEVRQSLTKDPFSPHTLKRLATPPKALRISEAIDAYIPSMVRVAELTPEARNTAVYLSGLPDSVLKEFATKYARIFFGVPSEYAKLDNLINNVSRTITKLSYSAALDLNPSWFVLHSTKIPFNVWPELGTKYATLGLKGMMSPEGQELVSRSGTLMDTMWQLKKPETKFGKTFSKILHSGMILSDRLDRGTAYIGGLEKAKDLGYFGPKENVGKITWKRLQELVASGVDIEKGLEFARSVVARSNFMYTNANVQTFVRENPLMGQFKSFPVRQAEMAANILRVWREAKAQHMEPEKFAALKAAQGQYEYVDAVGKLRRLILATVAAGFGAAGLTAAGVTQRIWPYHIMSVLSPPIMFAADTYKVLEKALDNKLSQKEFEQWLREAARTFVPGAGSIIRETGGKEKKKHSGMEPPPRTNWKQMDAIPKG